MSSHAFNIKKTFTKIINNLIEKYKIPTIFFILAVFLIFKSTSFLLLHL